MTQLAEKLSVPATSMPASAPRQHAPASRLSLLRPAPVAGLALGPVDHRATPAPARSLVGDPASPVRRTIEDKKKQPMTWADLEVMSGVSGAPRAVQLILKFWAETAHPATPVPFTTQPAIVALARGAAANMPGEFADWLGRDTLDELRASLKRLKISPTPAFATALYAREQVLVQAWTVGLGPSPSLPEAEHDPRFAVPAEYASRPAAASGRDDGGWHSVSSSLTGVTGSSTGSVNHALAQEAIATGALKQHADATATQICATCGQVTDATQFEVDHQQAFSELRDNLQLLARGMAVNANLYNGIQGGKKSFDRLFQTNGKPGTVGCEVLLTAEAVNVYSNDIGNLMRICRHCNGAWGKSDQDMFVWFRKSPYFGQAFIDAHFPLLGHTTVIARTKTGEGWGKAARDWFATHHLPALKQQFVLDEARRFLHKQVTKQSRTALEAQLEQEPGKKQALEQEADNLTGLNTAFLSSVDTTRQYYNSELQDLNGEPMGDPYPMAPGSPAILDREDRESFQKRQKRKKHQELSSTGPYRDGYDHGIANVPPSAKAHSGATLDAYLQGHADGRAEYLAAHERGVARALAVADPDQLPALATASPAEANEANGFRESAVYRIKAVMLGRQAGAAGLPPDPSVIPSGTPSSEVLLRDYLRGYASGMTSSSSSGTGPSTS